MGKNIDAGFPGRMMSSLVTHPWPGNIRELQNFITERSVILTSGSVLAPSLRGTQAIGRAGIGADDTGGSYANTHPKNSRANALDCRRATRRGDAPWRRSIDTVLPHAKAGHLTHERDCNSRRQRCGSFTRFPNQTTLRKPLGSVACPVFTLWDQQLSPVLGKEALRPFAGPRSKPTENAPCGERTYRAGSNGFCPSFKCWSKAVSSAASAA